MSRTYTQTEVLDLLQNAVEFGESIGKTLDRIRLLRWCSGAFLSGAGFVLIYQQFT